MNTLQALKAGFRSYKSDNVDYFLEHHDTYPLTIILFYDSEHLNEQLMRNLTVKILDVFVYKYERKLQKGNFNIKTTDVNTSTLSGGSSNFD